MTTQEDLWRGQFGDDYAKRNVGRVASNTAFFSRVLARASGIESIIELGAGTGQNLMALRALGFAPEQMLGVEINELAALSILFGNVLVASILDLTLPRQYDLAFTKGVLIHIAPDDLHTVYRKLYEASRRYVLICEYYNPTPVSVEYRGVKDALWKRDFAGDMLNLFEDMEVVDYGFVWHRDAMAPQDDLHWWLMEKR